MAGGCDHCRSLQVDASIESVEASVALVWKLLPITNNEVFLPKDTCLLPIIVASQGQGSKITGLFNNRFCDMEQTVEYHSSYVPKNRVNFLIVIEVIFYLYRIQKLQLISIFIVFYL